MWKMTVQTLLYGQKKVCELLGLIHPIFGSALYSGSYVRQARLASGNKPAPSPRPLHARTHAHIRINTRTPLCCLFLLTNLTNEPWVSQTSTPLDKTEVLLLSSCAGGQDSLKHWDDAWTHFRTSGVTQSDCQGMS